MQHKIPVIKEIALRLLNLDFFTEDSINSSEIQFNVTVKTKVQGLNKIYFFVTIKYYIESEESPFDTLFETDYIASIDVTDAIFIENSEKLIDSAKLSHLLGMSILMIRGAISIRLMGNTLSKFSLPTINPLNLLKSNLALNQNNFIVPIDEEE